MKALITLAALFSLNALADFTPPMSCSTERDSWAGTVVFTNWYVRGRNATVSITLKENNGTRTISGNCEHGSYVFGTKVFVDCAVVDSQTKKVYDAALVQEPHEGIEAYLVARPNIASDKKSVYDGAIGKLEVCDIAR